MAKVTGRTADGGAQVLVKNRIFENAAVDVLTPGMPTRPDRILTIIDEHGARRSPAQPGSRVTLYLNTPPQRLDLIRCPVDESGSKPP